ncbi:hypothetical protein NDU88_004518 [Pleurodeles waltl]|uniref:Uncharacterized protein n=1 Tax=Pleurodeles waltl TaxID=8319 RepID=A0AAV7SJ61_PLEWA|nr:hypothetical protein NDU88_004518 [Pleurodeles waltl]
MNPTCRAAHGDNAVSFLCLFSSGLYTLRRHLHFTGQGGPRDQFPINAPILLVTIFQRSASLTMRQSMRLTGETRIHRVMPGGPILCPLYTSFSLRGTSRVCSLKYRLEEALTETSSLLEPFSPLFGPKRRRATSTLRLRVLCKECSIV